MVASTSASVVQTASMVAMLGASMAAPLAMPPTVKPSPRTTTSLGTVSVVMIARAAKAPPSGLASRRETMPSSCGSTTLIGNGIPMSPVWHTRISSTAAPMPDGHGAAQPGAGVAARAHRWPRWRCPR